MDEFYYYILTFVFFLSFQTFYYKNIVLFIQWIRIMIMIRFVYFNIYYRGQIDHVTVHHHFEKQHRHRCDSTLAQPYPWKGLSCSATSAHPFIRRKRPLLIRPAVTTRPFCRASICFFIGWNLDRFPI